jgi:hypothetical protein
LVNYSTSDRVRPTTTISHRPWRLPSRDRISAPTRQTSPSMAPHQIHTGMVSPSAWI